MLTIEQMRKNVEQSRRHIEKQKGIIARLVDQGSVDAAKEAETLLDTMFAHLDTELDILNRMEAK